MITKNNTTVIVMSMHLTIITMVSFRASKNGIVLLNQYENFKYTALKKLYITPWPSHAIFIEVVMSATINADMKS
jgi:hypothetical protein